MEQLGANRGHLNELQSIFGFLSPVDLWRASNVSHLWQEVAKTYFGEALGIGQMMMTGRATLVPFSVQLKALHAAVSLEPAGLPDHFAFSKGPQVEVWQAKGEQPSRLLALHGEVVHALIPYRHKGEPRLVSMASRDKRDRDVVIALWNLRSGQKLSEWSGRMDYGDAIVSGTQLRISEVTKVTSIDLSGDLIPERTEVLTAPDGASFQKVFGRFFAVWEWSLSHSILRTADGKERDPVGSDLFEAGPWFIDSQSNGSVKFYRDDHKYEQQGVGMVTSVAYHPALGNCVLLLARQNKKTSLHFWNPDFHQKVELATTSRDAQVMATRCGPVILAPGAPPMLVAADKVCA